MGSTSPLLSLPELHGAAKAIVEAQLCANLNSYVLDYVARQKIQNVNVNLYILEQFPVVPPATYQEPLGNSTIGAYVCDQVLRLTYTAYDLAAFAHDLGYIGQPFAWDENDRAHRRARLEALYFHLYGIDDEADIAYILDTFSIVKRKDWEAHGHYRTLGLILKYHRMLLAKS